MPAFRTRWPRLALAAAYYYTDGLHPQDEMKSTLDLLLKGVDIKEY